MTYPTPEHPHLQYKQTMYFGAVSQSAWLLYDGAQKCAQRSQHHYVGCVPSITSDLLDLVSQISEIRA